MPNGQFAWTDATPSGASARFSRRILPLAVLMVTLALAGCGGSGNRAPIVDLNSSYSGGPGGTYVVKPGDSLYGIARRNGVDAASLQRVNNLTDPAHLTVGQVLTLPGGGAASGPMGTAPVAPPDSSKPLEPVPLDQPSSAGNPPPGQAGQPGQPGQTAQPGQQPPSDTTAPADPAAASAAAAPARADDADLINWAWPAQGAVTQKFSPPKNRGIDIAGKLGDPVVAAADGTVAYAGNGIPGLGNLVIIQHTNGFVTAYAHNQDLLVKCNQKGQDKGCPKVKQGARIATIGQTDATSPMLHFEIRKQGEAVDPLRYLPAR